MLNRFSLHFQINVNRKRFFSTFLSRCARRICYVAPRHHIFPINSSANLFSLIFYAIILFFFFQFHLKCHGISEIEERKNSKFQAINCRGNCYVKRNSWTSESESYDGVTEAVAKAEAVQIVISTIIDWLSALVCCHLSLLCIGFELLHVFHSKHLSAIVWMNRPAMPIYRI